MSVNNQMRTAVWNALLDAEYQRRYWHLKSAQVAKRERFIQIGLAILSSSALLTALGEIQQLWLWKVLSALTAIVATVQPFLAYSRQSIQMRDISAQWHKQEIDYDTLWLTVDHSAIDEGKFKALRDAEVEIFKTAVELPADDVAIQNSCFQQVLLSRGVQA